MRAHKSCLAAHPSWWSENPNTACPRCRSDAASFEHAILHCPARSSLRARYLEPTLSLSADSPLWDNKEPLYALSQYISATKTGFPPVMAPSPLPSRASSPSLPPSLVCVCFNFIFTNLTNYLFVLCFSLRQKLWFWAFMTSLYFFLFVRPRRLFCLLSRLSGGLGYLVFYV